MDDPLISFLSEESHYNKKDLLAHLETLPPEVLKKVLPMCTSVLKYWI